MQKIERTDILLNPIKSFTFIGDPGCDGLGTEIMSIFNAACLEANGDFILIGGDIVPEGTDRLYKNVVNMLDSNITTPVYMLAGNHDTLDYEKYFGKKNYFIYDGKLLIIVLDNSKRAFTQEAHEVLSQAIKHECENIVITFHIPPPNSVSGNSVSNEEWDVIEKIIAPVRSKVKYVLCGHVHSYFEDDIDGIRLVASGGGGARIEEVDHVSPPYYHFVEFSFNADGSLKHTFKPVSFNVNMNKHEEVANALKSAYAGECMAYVRYRLFAEDAERDGKPHLAKLFLAAADSEFYHARNFFYAMGDFKPPYEAILDSINNESDEVNEVYVKGENISKKHKSGLAAYAFNDARMAETVHLRLFNEAKKSLEVSEDIPNAEYYTCSSCGYTVGKAKSKVRCPVCGAPADKIYEVIGV